MTICEVRCFWGISGFVYSGANVVAKYGIFERASILV